MSLTTPRQREALDEVRQQVMAGRWHEERAIFVLRMNGLPNRFSRHIVRRWISEREVVRSGGPQ